MLLDSYLDGFELRQDISPHKRFNTHRWPPSCTLKNDNEILHCSVVRIFCVLAIGSK